jgi:transposase
MADLPWQGTPVFIELHSRRFHCKNPACRRSIFTERIPNFAASYARRTNRLNDSLSSIGFADGGRLGARLSELLSMSTSKDTIIRTIRKFPLSVVTTARVLGIDDFALRKGQRYGTILVDHEKHEVIDLLPDRTAETVTKWLKDHPGSDIINRDRAQAYAEAATQGAPNAQQVADRFHLLDNLGDHLEQFMEGKYKYVRQAAEEIASIQQGEILLEQEKKKAEQPITETITQRNIIVRRERRSARFNEVIKLHQQGVSGRMIAKKFGMNKTTVYHYLRLETLPAITHPRSKYTQLTPFHSYIKERWDSGCKNVAQIYRELRAKGYQGGTTALKEYVRDWRTILPVEFQRGNIDLIKSTAPPSARRIAWFLRREFAELDAEDQTFLIKLCDICPEITLARSLAQDFISMVKGLNGKELDNWLNKVKESGISELGSFAKGIIRDKAEVLAGLTLPYSNGQTEGQVNRLKYIKRQMYGRAKFDLLKKRVLIKI